jgi:hypothetical protein
MDILLSIIGALAFAAICYGIYRLLKKANK